MAQEQHEGAVEVGRVVRFFGVDFHGRHLRSSRLPRQRDLVNVAWAVRTKEFPEGTPVSVMRQGWWVDVSQDIIREPWTSKMKTFTRETIMYSFEHDFVLSGHDMLLSLGIPRAQAPQKEFSNGELRSMSGEGYPAPLIGALTMLFWLNPWAPWWRPGTQPGHQAASGSGP